MYVVELRQDDMLEAILEIDLQLRIKAAGVCAPRLRMCYLTMLALANQT